MQRTYDGISLAGKRVLVVGLGREGESLVRYISPQAAEVTVTDVQQAAHVQERVARLPFDNVRFALGSSDPAIARNADVVFVSPGVPEDNPLVDEARQRSIFITNATQLFFERCPATIVGVTGSSGKSTTTSLIASILSADGRRVLLGGNIGYPMLDLLDDADAESIAVVELSSFQLELVQLSPSLAVVTNLSPNHLDRHGSMEQYVAAKRHIVAHQGSNDVAVLNADDPAVARLAEDTRARIVWFSRRRPIASGAFVRGDMVVVRVEDDELAIMSTSEMSIPGLHNLENVLAAVAAASTLDTGSIAMRNGVRRFPGLPHRLERVALVDGVCYVNDSIATSPARVAVALQALSEPVVLILGGRSKHLPWDPLLDAMAGRVRAVVLLGEAADEIAAALAGGPASVSTIPLRRAHDMDDAVRLATVQAEAGDTVLLAPACTSYDMYTDFAERGAAFRRAVEAMHGRPA